MLCHRRRTEGMRCSPIAAAMYAATVGLGTRSAEATCTLEGGSCICTDDSGGSWDVTQLTPAGNTGAGTTVVARGACSGTYCETGFVYHVDFCESLEVPSACYSGSCCSPNDNLNFYRTDERATCPPATTCQCDKLGDLNAGGVTVTALQEEDGISIEFTNNA